MTRAKTTSTIQPLPAAAILTDGFHASCYESHQPPPAPNVADTERRRQDVACRRDRLRALAARYTTPKSQADKLLAEVASLEAWLAANGQ